MAIEMSMLLCTAVLAVGTSGGAPNCGDLATISPLQLTLERWSTATLNCIYGSPCHHIETWYLYRGGLNSSTQQDTDVFQDATLRTIVSRSSQITSGGMCFLEVDLSWSGSEDIRNELQSRQLYILLVVNKTACRTNSTSIEFSDAWRNSSIEIFPDSELLIDPGGSSALSCTAPCSIHGSNIEIVVFNIFTVEDGAEEEINSTIRGRVLSAHDFKTTASNCTYTVNVSYPEDEAVRSILDAVRCTVIYSSTGSNATIHRSHGVKIIYTDGDAVTATTTRNSTDAGSSSSHSSDNNSAFSKHKNQNNIFLMTFLLSSLLTMSM